MKDPENRSRGQGWRGEEAGSLWAVRVERGLDERPRRLSRQVFLPALHFRVMFKIGIPTWNEFRRTRVIPKPNFQLRRRNCPSPEGERRRRPGESETPSLLLAV